MNSHNYNEYTNSHKNKEENYYSVLGCNESATYEELKHKYQELIKQYHPDKQNEPIISAERFILISKAFKTLKDEKLRKEYNALLLESSFNDNPIIFAELLQSDLEFVNGQSSFNCRCGNDIIIPLNMQEVIIECSECSNCILIK